MGMPTKEEIATELMRRGVPPEKIAAAGFPQIARQGQAGLIAPPLAAPDAMAARQAYGKDYGTIRDSREALGRFAPNMTQLDRFQAANRNRATGGIQSQDYQGWEKANPLNWPGMIANGVSERWDGDYQVMSGIASGLQGQARPAGSGATSDFEQRLYRQGVPSPEKTGPVNDATIAYMKGTLAEENDRLAFQEEFLRRNGSLNGSTQAWTRYVQANPYGVDTPRGFRPNSKRQPWDQYFGVSAPPRSTDAYARAKESFLTTWREKRGSDAGGQAAFDKWWPSEAKKLGLPAPRAAGPVKKTAPDPLGIRGR